MIKNEMMCTNHGHYGICAQECCTEGNETVFKRWDRHCHNRTEKGTTSQVKMDKDVQEQFGD